jgi:hypothetical protein
MLPIPFTYYMLELCGFCLFEQEANWILGFLRNIYGRNSAHLPAFQEINVEVSLVAALLCGVYLSPTFPSLPDHNCNLGTLYFQGLV